MKLLIQGFLIATTVVCLAGCSSVERRAQKLTLGMSKSQATELLGSDYRTVAARTDPDGSAVSVISYELKKKQPLFLYFRQDKLVQWGDSSALRAMPGVAETK